MRDIPNQVNGIDSLDDYEYNDVKNEIRNAITNTGQTLSSGDLHQLSKSMAESAAYNDAYTDIGTQNNIVLDTQGSMQFPQSYVEGLRVRFRPAFVNSSSSVTARVGTLSTVPVSSSPSDSPAVIPSSLNTNLYYEMVYTSTPNGLSKYFLITSMVQEDFLVPDTISSTELKNNSVIKSKIANSSVDNDKLDDDIQLDKISGGSLGFTESSETILLDSSRMKLGTDVQPYVDIKRRGIRFDGSGSPGSVSGVFGRWAIYNVAAAISGASAVDPLWVSDVDTTAYPSSVVDDHLHSLGTIYTFSGDGFSTSISYTSVVLYSAISYTGTDGKKYDAVPCRIICENVGSNRYVKYLSVYWQDYSFGAAPSAAYPIYLTIFHNGVSL